MGVLMAVQNPPPGFRIQAVCQVAPHRGSGFHRVSLGMTSPRKPITERRFKAVDAVDRPSRQALLCDQFEIAKRPLPPNYIHPDFQDVDAVAPAMGNHLIDLTGPEFNG